MINKIEEWGKWARHTGYERHSTPMYALMRANGCFHLLLRDIAKWYLTPLEYPKQIKRKLMMVQHGIEVIEV